MTFSQARLDAVDAWNVIGRPDLVKEDSATAEVNYRQVIDAMQLWKNESKFGDFIVQQSTFPTAPPYPLPNAKRFTQLRKEDFEALQCASDQLQHVKTILERGKEDLKAISQLMGSLRRVRILTASQTAAQRFKMLNPLRAWLLWLPVIYLQQAQESPYVLLILAFYYTMALVIEPIFPEVGTGYFGSLSLAPIEEIAQRLFSISLLETSDHHHQTVLVLIEYPKVCGV
jgi:hypothetical protein